MPNSWLSLGEGGSPQVIVYLNLTPEFPGDASELCEQAGSHGTLWGTLPSVGNVAQPPLGKASGERGWWAGPTSMDRFSGGK